MKHFFILKNPSTGRWDVYEQNAPVNLAPSDAVIRPIAQGLSRVRAHQVAASLNRPLTDAPRPDAGSPAPDAPEARPPSEPPEPPEYFSPPPSE